MSVSMDEGSGSSFGQASQETRNDDEVERFLRKIDMEKVGPECTPSRLLLGKC